jgi:G2/mitotic-specific cyclin-B3
MCCWKQNKFAVKDYMSRQHQLTGGMRAILIDWLIEVQQNFELHHETLYLAVALTDLYLVQQPVSKDRLQLLGATALLVASKFEVCWIFVLEPKN